MPSRDWQSPSQIEPRQFTCGFCGNLVASKTGYYSAYGDRIYVCPYCENATYFTEGRQVPGEAHGGDVEELPPIVRETYQEIRDSMRAPAYTGAVLLARKLLMNLAVQKGAEEGLPFTEYVSFLADNGYVPPEGRPWVDKIRTQGNEATHEIAVRQRSEAAELVSFLEMLLKFMFEFPGKLGHATGDDAGSAEQIPPGGP